MICLSECEPALGSSFKPARIFLNRFVRGVFLVGLLGIIQSPSFAIAQEPPSEVEFIASVQDAVLSESDIATLKPEAVAGSAAAAHRLSRFYQSVLLDFEEGRYWARIAAENGGAGNAYNYKFALATDPDLSGCERLRARFWIEKARSEAGEDAELRSLAESLLAELDDQSKSCR